MTATIHTTKHPFVYLQVLNNGTGTCHIAIPEHVHELEPTTYIVPFKGKYKRCKEIIAVCEAIVWNVKTAATISKHHARVCEYAAECLQTFEKCNLVDTLAQDKQLAARYHADLIAWKQWKEHDDIPRLPYLHRIMDVWGMPPEDAAEELEEALYNYLDNAQTDFHARVELQQFWDYGCGLQINKNSKHGYYTTEPATRHYDSYAEAERALMEYAITNGLWSPAD